MKDTPVTKVTSLRLEPDIYSELKVQAAREKRTVSELVGSLIKEYLKLKK